MSIGSNFALNISKGCALLIFCAQCSILGSFSVYTKILSKGDVFIQESVQFSEVSDLNGEHPQFILTCTSTGGPATTVVWTRDSESVSGGMTVLDNTETAQYTHTLTVAGRLPGHYMCNVSNNKPSQALASYTVEGNVMLISL